jgi:N-sulfoglucosamine sulfohydrolase
MNTSNKRPNVLMFIPHDTGDHLKCYGHDSVRSPNLDQLAKTGVRFTNCFTTAPECTPSRSGLYTGLYTHQNGLMGLCHRGWSLNSDAKHLAEYLREAGYQTCLFGINHETAASPEQLGYNQIFAQKESRNCFHLSKSVSDWIENDACRDDKPWFASVGFADTHRLWRPAKDFIPEDIEVPPYLPDTPEVRADLAELHQAIYDMDIGIGQVLAALDKSGLDKNTIIVYTVDHGIPFPRAKSTFYDPGIRVPMIMKLPEYCGENGKVHEQLISNLDYTPSILDLCGVKVPDGLAGRSMKPLLEGAEYVEHDAVFGALYYDSHYDPMHYVRTQKYKYIRSFAVTPEDAEGADPDMLATHECGSWIRADDSDVQRSPSWEIIRESGPFSKPPPEELYDLEKDPQEKKNLCDDPAYADILKDLRFKLKQMMEQTNSPLLKGHVSPELSRTRNLRVNRKG